MEVRISFRRDRSVSIGCEVLEALEVWVMMERRTERRAVSLFRMAIFKSFRILTSRGGIGAVVVEVVEVKRRQRGRDVRIALLPNMLKDVFIAKVSSFN